MDDAGRVGGGERVRQRDRDPQRLAEAHPLARDEALQRLARDELHDDVVDALGRLDLVDRDDVRVVERGGGAGLLDETGAAVRVDVPLGGEDLDRDLAPEAGVAGPVDLAHAPGAEGRDHLVRPEPRCGRQGHVELRVWAHDALGGTTFYEPFGPCPHRALGSTRVAEESRVPRGGRLGYRSGRKGGERMRISTVVSSWRAWRLEWPRRRRPPARPPRSKGQLPRRPLPHLPAVSPSPSSGLCRSGPSGPRAGWRGSCGSRETASPATSTCSGPTSGRASGSAAPPRAGSARPTGSTAVSRSRGSSTTRRSRRGSPGTYQAEQVRSVAIERIGQRVGQLKAPLLAELDEALRLHLAL